MSRLALIAGLSLFAVATTGYRDRLKALEADAAAQRQKLGLDNDAVKLYAKYPTPEMSFEGDPVDLPCGGTAKVALPGKFVPGTAFVVSNDDVQIADARTDAAGWQAKLRAAPNAAPDDVHVHAITPVSGAERSMLIARLTGTVQLDLRFDDGWTAHFAGDSLTWKKGAQTRTTRAEVRPGHPLRLDWERSPEEIAAGQAAMKQLTSEEMQAPMQKAMERMQECLKKAQAEQQACMQSVNADIEKFNEKVKAQQEQAEKARPSDAWACADARLDAQGGSVTGTATCPPHERKMKITGTLRCAAKSGE